MNYYQEVTLLPDGDISTYFIWQKLYQQIHIALAENKNSDGTSGIGVSFPEYDAENFLLGATLRLFALEQQSLQALQCEKWLSRLHDYVNIKPIAPVPENILGHACFRQAKMKGSKEKLARRRAKRKGETFEQALAHFADYKEDRSRLPYINMVSQSTGQRFRLFIKKDERNKPQAGHFTFYGLSKGATVPLF